MSDIISTLGVTIASSNILIAGKTQLELLNQQLASGVQHTNLSDYSANDAQKLLNLNATENQNNSFIGVINNIGARISVYNESLTGIEGVGASITNLAHSAAQYNSTTNGTTATQIQGLMQQVNYYLNQKVGDRYIFSGTRYSTAPVGDITSLPTLTTSSSTATTSNPALPDYDTEAIAGTASDSAAYVQDSVAIDTTQKLTYGISSNQTSFQQLVLGLRFAYAATQDPTNYQSLMQQASNLVNTGLSGIQAIHTGLANANNTLNTVKDQHTQAVNDINKQIGDIQNVDTTEISVKITSLQTQLQASYSATAQLSQLSILKYL